MKIKKLSAFFLSLILILTLFTGCDKDSEIQINLKKGDKYKISETIEQNVSVSPLNERIDVVQKMSYGYTYDVIDVNEEGITTISTKFDSIYSEQTTPNGTQKYDSKTDIKSTGPQNIVYNSMIGKGFTIKIDKEGKIKSLDGIDKLYEDMISEIGGLNENQKQSLKENLKENFGDKIFTSALSGLTNMYPDKKVGVGDTWKTENTMDLGVSMKMNNTWKLKEYKNDIFTIGLNSKISSDTSGKEIDFGGMKMKLNISGNEEGTVKINKNDGLLQNSDISLNAKGSASISVSGENINMPVTIKSKVTYKTEKQ